MTPLFVLFGIMLLVLLVLLVWFVPQQLQKQAVRVSGETSQLREMLLDLLNEQEAVTLRQTQLGGSLGQLREQIDVIADRARASVDGHSASSQELQLLEARLVDLQQQLHIWTERTARGAHQNAQDNESWAHLMSLLNAIQERVGTLSQDRSAAKVGVQARTLLEDLEGEMLNLRSISEDIEKLQWRLRQSMTERDLQQHVRRSSSQFDTVRLQ